MDYKVIIAGGRHFNDYELLKDKCNYYLSNKFQTHHVIIVSGHAPGADSLGEKYAAEYKLQCELHPADWEQHGKAAGPIRNAEMAEDLVIQQLYVLQFSFAIGYNLGTIDPMAIGILLRIS